MSAASRRPGRAPASEGRSRTPFSAAGDCPSWRTARSRLSAATGSPGRVARRATARQATSPTAPRTAARTAPATATRGVGTPGHAWAVRPCSRARTQRTPNGGMRAPATAAASRAAAQASHASAARPQNRAISAHATAAFPDASGGRGPIARLTAPSAGARARPVRPGDLCGGHGFGGFTEGPGPVASGRSLPGRPGERCPGEAPLCLPRRAGAVCRCPDGASRAGAARLGAAAREVIPRGCAAPARGALPRTRWWPWRGTGRLRRTRLRTRATGHRRSRRAGGRYPPGACGCRCPSPGCTASQRRRLLDWRPGRWPLSHGRTSGDGGRGGGCPPAVRGLRATSKRCLAGAVLPSASSCLPAAWKASRLSRSASHRAYWSCFSGVPYSASIRAVSSSAGSAGQTPGRPGRLGSRLGLQRVRQCRDGGPLPQAREILVDGLLAPASLRHAPLTGPRIAAVVLHVPVGDAVAAQVNGLSPGGAAPGEMRQFGLLAGLAAWQHGPDRDAEDGFAEFHRVASLSAGVIGGTRRSRPGRGFASAAAGPGKPHGSARTRAATEAASRSSGVGVPAAGGLAADGAGVGAWERGVELGPLGAGQGGGPSWYWRMPSPPSLNRSAMKAVISGSRRRCSPGWCSAGPGRSRR